MRLALATLALACTWQAGAMVIDPVDPAFGVAVVKSVRDQFGGYVELHGLAVAPNGRVAVLLIEYKPRADGTRCMSASIMRFTSGGTVDASFAAQGRATTQMLGLPCMGRGRMGFAWSGDGSFYIAGNPEVYPYAKDDLLPTRVWRIDANGQGDAAFGAAVLPALVHSMGQATVRVLPDGRIAVGGLARLHLGQDNPVLALAAMRLRANGAIDTEFGIGGIAYAIPGNRPIDDSTGSMVVDADGTVYVAGNIFEDDAGAKIYRDATVVRFDAQGTFDRNYGDGGFAIPLADASTRAQSLAVADGAAYVAGNQNRDVVSAFVVKLKANGTTDLAFGQAGTITIDGFNEQLDSPLVAVDSTGRVYVVLGFGNGFQQARRYLADGTPDLGFGLEGAAFISADGWRLSYASQLVMLGDTPYVGAANFISEDRTDFAFGVARLAPDGGHRADVTGGTAQVYYNAALGHYFLTASAPEQALLDSGATPGWARTGKPFRVVTAGADAEVSPVCRYYGRPQAHLDSHFFSASPAECAAVAEKFAASWLLETPKAFAVHLPDPETGACPRGSERIVRAFNGRPDANHFYGVLGDLAPSGWTYEGYGPGPFPTAFCAPLL